MRLFLLLSALLAGLTGLIAGAPAQARTSEPAAIAAALSAPVNQTRDATEAQCLPTKRESFVEDREARRAPERALLPQLHPVDERRIE